MKLKLGTNNIRFVEVQPNYELYVLLKKLKITDKNSKLIFNGTTYSIVSILTFKEIGLTFDTGNSIINHAIAE